MSHDLVVTTASAAGGVALILASAGAEVGTVGAATPVAIVGGFTGGTMFAGGLTLMVAAFQNDMTAEEEEHLDHIPQNFCGTFSLPFGPEVSKTMEGAEDIARFGQGAFEINDMTEALKKGVLDEDFFVKELHFMEHMLEVAEHLFENFKKDDSCEE